MQKDTITCIPEIEHIMAYRALSPDNRQAPYSSCGESAVMLEKHYRLYARTESKALVQYETALSQITSVR